MWKKTSTLWNLPRFLEWYSGSHIFYTDSVGKLPTNKQIDVALTNALDSHALKSPSEKLSSEGRKLVEDLREVIYSAKCLWLKKNCNEELQNFLFHSKQRCDAPDSTDTSGPISEDNTQGNYQRALKGLRTLGRLLATNGQFRKLLKDVTLLILDMAADAASYASQKIRPGQERLG